MGGQGIGELAEGHGSRGQGQTALLGVPAIVQADAQNAPGLGDHRGRRGLGKAPGPLRQGSELGEPLVPQGDGLGHVRRSGHPPPGGLRLHVHDALGGLKTKGGSAVVPKLNQFHK